MVQNTKNSTSMVQRVGNAAQRWLSPGKKENEKKRIKREMRKEDKREDINVRYMNLS